MGAILETIAPAAQTPEFPRGEGLAWPLYPGAKRVVAIVEGQTVR